METGSSRVLVLPRAGGGWELRETRTGPVLARAATKGELIGRARLGLETARGGEIVVLDADGTVRSTHPVSPAPARPWWYVRPGLLRWVVPLFGLSQVARFVVSEHDLLDVVLGLLGCVLLVLAVVGVRRSVLLDRARTAADDDRN